MIAKILQSGYNDSGSFPQSAIIPEFRGGLDKDTLRKRASIFDNEYDKFERKPGHTYIHLISVAAGEHYGPNSRADFYNGDSYEHEAPEPAKGCAKIITLDGGLNKYHDETFMKEGGVYTEHYSSRDGANPQGYIVAAKMNPTMKRGELIIGVRTNEWEDDIQKLSGGTPLKFSIGCDVANDTCSYCHHKAFTEDGHCDHYKNHRGAITEDGHQIYVISDKCIFHDISRVRTPAEKIAFSIKKIAHADNFNMWQPGNIRSQSAKYMVKTSAGQRRFDTLNKLAKIEKEILAMATKGGLDEGIIKFFKARRQNKKASDMSGGEALNKFLDAVSHEQLFGALKEGGKILTPGEFVMVAVPKEYRDGGYGISTDAVESQLPGIFGRILHRDDLDNFCDDVTYDYSDVKCPAALIDVLRRTQCGCAIDVNDITKKLMSFDNIDLQPRHKTIIIEISKPTADVNELIANDYANYVVSAADKFSPAELAMSILNYII